MPPSWVIVEVNRRLLKLNLVKLKWWNRELTLKCKLKCYVKPMKDPLNVSPSKRNQETTRAEGDLGTKLSQPCRRHCFGLRYEDLHEAAAMDDMYRHSVVGGISLGIRACELPLIPPLVYSLWGVLFNN